MKSYSLKELKQYNGKKGKEVYILYDGLVYDVTDSFLWRSGKHQALHQAGEDLTGKLENAPHGIEFIKRFPVVGYLRKNCAI